MKISAVAVLAVAAIAATDTAADFALVKDGAPCARIAFGATLGAKAAASATNDVALFNKYLKTVTGAELPLADAHRTFANAVQIDLRPIDRLDTRYEWRIDFPTSGVMRVEATTISLFTALRHVLEEGCDARFLGAENCMFQFEPRKDVAVDVR
ncbi:MAG: hypothetical protein IJK04_00710, partial [Kiritimatiellae bacterium]|nr:hypothetical protein [Kiritimatiellia bacterium]